MWQISKLHCKLILQAVTPHTLISVGVPEKYVTKYGDEMRATCCRIVAASWELCQQRSSPALMRIKRRSFELRHPHCRTRICLIGCRCHPVITDFRTWGLNLANGIFGLKSRCLNNSESTGRILTTHSWCVCGLQWDVENCKQHSTILPPRFEYKIVGFRNLVAQEK